MQRTDVTPAIQGQKAHYVMRSPIAQNAIGLTPLSTKTSQLRETMATGHLTRAGEVRLTLTTEIKEPA